MCENIGHEEEDLKRENTPARAGEPSYSDFEHILEREIKSQHNGKFCIKETMGFEPKIDDIYIEGDGPAGGGEILDPRCSIQKSFGSILSSEMKTMNSVLNYELYALDLNKGMDMTNTVRIHDSSNAYGLQLTAYGSEYVDSGLGLSDSQEMEIEYELNMN
ncbi:MAG: hypothetical protein NTZ10_04790 [Candidatus Saganbacteria bacterium]|nr:hypothetical protein [Candidatus Saganbacteria bacterium]